jgi:TRAP-type C4-dicarboxylate transport system permease small subunit
MTRKEAFKKFLVVIDFLSTAGMYASGIGISLMALFITLEIAGRHLFGYSMLIVDEWSGYLLVIVTFLGLAYTLKTKGFLQIEFFLNRLSPRLRSIFNAVLILLALLYSLVIQYKLIVHVWSSYTTGQVSISISQTPLYIPQLFMPVGMSLLILQLIKEGAHAVFDLVQENSDKQKPGRDNIP